MPKKRLWIVNQYATPPSLPGITRHYSLGKHLVSRGWEVTIFTSNFRHETKELFFPSLDRLSYTEEYDGVKFVFVNQKIAYRSNSLARIRNILEFGRRVRGVLKEEGFRQPPDVLLGSSFHFLNAEAAFWAARKFHALPVLEVRDLWPEALVYLRGIPEHHPAVRLLAAWSRRLYRQGKGVVALSRAIERKIKSYVPDKPTLVLPNPVDLDLFTKENLRGWDDLEPVQAMKESDARARLLYIGTVGEANAFETIWKAAHLLKNEDVAFFVVGHGEKFEFYRKSAEEEGLNMRFFKPVPKRAVPALLNQADGLVAAIHPSFAHYGGSMNKLNDYMVAGKPIFYSGPKANTPFEEVDCAEVVPPMDAAALAESVRRFLKQPVAFRSRALHCRRYAEENLTAEKLADRLDRFLHALR